MIYQSYRKFKIWGYTVSHSSLLLRSVMKFVDEDGYSESTSYNIDIEFWGVTFISIPAAITSLEIHEIPKELLPKYIDRGLYQYNQKIFEIQDEDKKYYIIAGGLLVGTNRWVNEDRIFNYDLNLEYDKVIVSA